MERLLIPIDLQRFLVARLSPLAFLSLPGQFIAMFTGSFLSSAVAFSEQGECFLRNQSYSKMLKAFLSSQDHPRVLGYLHLPG